jgi:hypothetical protein
MTTSVSRRLNILIIAFFIKRLFTQLYVRVGILLTRGKYLHVCIVSIKWDVCDHKTSLTPPLFIEVLVAIQESEWSCLYGHVYGCYRCPFRFFLWLLYWILEMFRQCGILEMFRQCGILEMFRQCGILEMFRQCGIFRNVPTLWYG